jgi:hypothetical protein
MPLTPALRYQVIASGALSTVRLKKTFPLLPYQDLCCWMAVADPL